ncbi:hypothetical protein D3C71_1658530 [compost metagenome]
MGKTFQYPDILYRHFVGLQQHIIFQDQSAIHITLSQILKMIILKNLSRQFPSTSHDITQDEVTVLLHVDNIMAKKMRRILRNNRVRNKRKHRPFAERNFRFLYRFTFHMKKTLISLSLQLQFSTRIYRNLDPMIITIQ